ncbi:PorH family porin [Corynebacteriaceae bacterium 6-324]
MDLSFVQEQLDTFATFAGAIGDFLQLPARILGSVVDWFGESETEGVSNIEADWDITKGAFGSSTDEAPAE